MSIPPFRDHWTVALVAVTCCTSAAFASLVILALAGAEDPPGLVDAARSLLVAFLILSGARAAVNGSVGGK